MILFGHPTGSPFSHHAALAHLEAGQLEAFCVPWMPTKSELNFLCKVPGLRGNAERLARRSFAPLVEAEMIQGKMGEWMRMARRVLFDGRYATEALSYEANDWLMRTMSRESRRGSVKAVHAYEDCSLWTFEEAKRQGKGCIYNLPIGYYPAWEQKQQALIAEYADWLPPEGLSSSLYVRPQQKLEEMRLADLVLVPCSFVKSTIDQFIDKDIVVAPFGVDLEFWRPDPSIEKSGPLRFVYAGQCALRKGVPVLLEAWRRAELKEATLDLVGGWRFSESRKQQLPQGVTWFSPVSSERLRTHFQDSDVFVFPSFFEGFGMVILEAMACGLPVITTEATAGPDILDEHSGRIFSSGDIDALTELLRWFSEHRASLPLMRREARRKAEQHEWQGYRRRVSSAAMSFG